MKPEVQPTLRGEEESTKTCLKVGNIVKMLWVGPLVIG
jgi:hypothetical protein